MYAGGYCTSRKGRTMNYSIHQDSETGEVVVSHYEHRVDLPKSGKPRKDRRTYKTVVVDGTFAGEHRWLEGQALLAELKGNPSVAAGLRRQVALATAPSPTSPPGGLMALLALRSSSALHTAAAADEIHVFDPETPRTAPDLFDDESSTQATAHTPKPRSTDR